MFEDAPVLAELMRYVLTKHDYEIPVVSNGSEELKEVRTLEGSGGC